ncbi:MAG: BMP family ABC transporter substrate-binding protein, partial [Clostridia bacterium]|nr:BMP family ABC transporter substrate-binding protein [Clostridia bacterium]
ADSMGAPNACEEADVPTVSSNGSTFSAAPKTFLVSSRINWAPYYKYLIDCKVNDKNADKNYVGTIKTGSVELTDLGDAVAAGTDEKLAAVKAQLEAGTLHVFDTATFTVEGKKLDTYLADVKDEGDYKGETEVISDGYFHESEYRSAPYFDLTIDGITLLDTNFGD